ncbi:MAG: hypothetical protein ACFCU6_03030 [Balneolaceae bacterium]
MLTSTQKAEAQEVSLSDAIHLLDGSKLWLEGDTNVNKYQCEADTLSGFGRLEDAEKPQDTIQGHGKVYIDVEIPVFKLDCGKKAMNRDMYNALKAEQHPRIQYSLKDAELINIIRDENNVEWMNIRTTGFITVAGVDREIEVYVLGKVLDNNQFHVVGEKELDMTEFNITPPRALFGLIKAREYITIKFDVIVALDDMNF